MDAVAEQIVRVHGEMVTERRWTRGWKSYIIGENRENDVEIGRFKEDLFKQKRDKGVISTASNCKVGQHYQRRAPIATKLEQREGLTLDLNQRREIRILDIKLEGLTDEGKSRAGVRVEALTCHLEMLVFEGWNPEEWIFRVEKFSMAHKLIETGKKNNGNHH